MALPLSPLPPGVLPELAPALDPVSLDPLDIGVPLVAPDPDAMPEPVCPDWGLAPELPFSPELPMEPLDAAPDEAPRPLPAPVDPAELWELSVEPSPQATSARTTVR
jgi:hypothetical protein